MKGQIIFDNETREAHLFVGWGFSVMIGNYLFDTGDTGPHLLENLQRLQYSIYDVEAVIISHDHYDHWGGLWELLSLLPGLPVYGCSNFSDTFKSRVEKAGGKLIEIDGFRQFSDNLYSTGQIEGMYKSEPIWEQSLIIKTECGISVCTGCAHPGVEKITMSVRTRFPEEKGKTIFGGFHLKNDKPDEIDRVIARLFDLGFENIYPGHCSGEYAKKRGTGRLYVGAVIDT